MRETQTNCKRIRNYEPEDRISNLPDEIICHILSFIPSKSAYRTNILSKRWKNLSTKVITLDINSNDSTSIEFYEPLTPQQYYRLHNVVHEVLSRHDAPYLERFRLCFDRVDECALCIYSWLVASTAWQILEIDIAVNCPWFTDLISLPCEFFSRERLKVLKLKGRFSFDDKAKLHLPNLEIVHFSEVVFPSDEFMRMMISSCRVLQELVVFKCGGITSTLHVQSGSLRILHVDRIYERRIVIDAPNLRYLRLGYTLKWQIIGDLRLLNEVDLGLAFPDDYCALQGSPLTPKVKTLRLKKYHRVLGRVGVLPVFHNLVSLKLGNVDDMWAALACAPLLRSLIFKEIVDDCLYESKPVPLCMSTLESVCLNWWFSGLKKEMALISYFSRFGSMLKEIEIHMAPMTAKCEIFLYGRLLMLPKLSSTCQFKVMNGMPTYIAPYKIVQMELRCFNPS